tara:strand:+ start:9943 stop:10266 length:324 start_codon:yes stop_codon:yes gene_type:complete
MILHTVNKSPFASQCLVDCLRCVTSGDVVLLIENGVYGSTCLRATTLTPLQKSITELAATGVLFYILSADLEARGLDRKSLLTGLETVDYDGFVDLVSQSDKVISWY